MKFRGRDVLEIQGQLLKDMAMEMCRTALEQFPDWTESFYEFCYGNRDSGVGRLLVRSLDHRMKIFPMPHQLQELFTCLEQLRPKLPNSDWWGMSIHVTRDGAVDVKYDYDPDCIERFFKDEDAHLPF